MSYPFGGIQHYSHDCFSERTYAASPILLTRRKGRLHDYLCRPQPDRQGVDRAKERARKGPRKSEGYAPSSLPNTLAWHQTCFFFCILKFVSSMPRARPRRVHPACLPPETRRVPQPPLRRANIPSQSPERRKKLRHGQAGGAHAAQRGALRVGGE